MQRSRRRKGRALRVLISAGPTREPIDPARFVSNYSTGYMGAQLAAEALGRGHRVTVVSGPLSERLPSGARVIPVEQAREMDQAMRRQAGRADVIIMAAAVADFRPAHVAVSKLTRQGRRLLQLEATLDIVARLPRRAGQLVVGFGVESDAILARAARKLRAKRLDLLVAQYVPSPTRVAGGHANGSGAPFGRHKVHAWLLARGGSVTPLGVSTKPRIARVLLDKVEALWYGQRRLEG